MDVIRNVIIIGGGVSGLTAALYAARAELSPLVFANNLDNKGGLLVKTAIVENYPGFPEGILGFDLIKNMEDQAVKYGATVINKEIIRIDFSGDIKKIYTKNEEFLAKTIILATGSKPNKLGIPNEDKFWSKGLSSCCICDSPLYKKKKVIVVGGGDTALSDSLYMTKFSDVTLIHRRDTFRGSKILQNQVLNNNKIKIIWDTIITDLHSKEDNPQSLGSVTIKNVKTGVEEKLAVDGLFYGLGLTPNTHLFKNILELDSEGYIISGKQKIGVFSNRSHNYETSTSIPGVFVCGDSADKIYRQAVVAAGDGCRAALDANHYLENLSNS